MAVNMLAMAVVSVRERKALTVKMDTDTLQLTRKE
jgi:hypothetical protein